MLIGSLAAYSLARFNTGGRHFAFWLLSQRMMPPVVLVIPFFLLLRDLGQDQPAIGLDQHVALIALYTVFNLPFVIWMMRSYFERAGRDRGERHGRRAHAASGLWQYHAATSGARTDCDRHLCLHL